MSKYVHMIYNLIMIKETLSCIKTEQKTMKETRTKGEEQNIRTVIDSVHEETSPL